MDAEALGCVDEVRHARRILVHGTSAHRQLQWHQQALADGATLEEAERAVVDELIAATAAGVELATERGEFLEK